MLVLHPADKHASAKGANKTCFKGLSLLHRVGLVLDFLVTLNERSGRRRREARPGLAKMYRVPQDWPWRPVVGAPLEECERTSRIPATATVRQDWWCESSIYCVGTGKSMDKVIREGAVRVGLDLAMRAIQVHAVDAAGRVLANRTLPRSRFIEW